MRYRHRTATLLAIPLILLGACSAGPEPGAPGPIDDDPSVPASPYQPDDVVGPDEPDPGTGEIDDGATPAG